MAKLDDLIGRKGSGTFTDIAGRLEYEQAPQAEAELAAAAKR